MQYARVLLLLGQLFLATPGIAAGVPFELPADLVAPTGPHSQPSLKISVPADSPLTTSRIALGELLFSDKRLSRDQSLACIGCHQVENSFTSSIVTGNRNPPVIFNRLFSEKQFWNARADSLEEQVRQTMNAPLEMNLSGKAAIARLRRDPKLVERFQKTFGKSGIEESDLYRALASFVRSIVSYDSKYDRSNRTGVTSVELSEIEEKGRQLFFEKFKCSVCHSGPNFTNEILSPPCYPQFGQAVEPASTKRQPFNREFKTPSLRGLAKSAPYFHDGSLAKIEETIEFYDRSGPPPMHFLKAELFQVPISSISNVEIERLKAFLGTLNGRIEYGHPRKSVGY